MRIKNLILLATALLWSACAPATPSKEDLNDQLEATITRESELWSALKIDSYQLTAKHSSVWANYMITIKVKANEITDSEITCGDALLEEDSSACNEYVSDVSPERYTVPGLFEELKTSRQSFEPPELADLITSSWSESVAITFDPQYHFPRKIFYDIPEVSDDEATVEILDFIILQE